MKCYVCDGETYSTEPKIIRCAACRELLPSDLFLKLQTFLIQMQNGNKSFDQIREKCVRFDAVIKNYALYVEPRHTFDVQEYDCDRTALHYLQNYAIAEDNHFLQNYTPVKMDPSENHSLYKALALLCRLDIENGSRELRVRNVIDMVINAETYHQAEPELHSCFNWNDTWQHFVLEQLHEKRERRSPNATLTLCLASLANILDLKIRSIYPKIPGGSEDLRKRLNHVFIPVDLPTKQSPISTLAILWSSNKHISTHSTSSMWIPDCVVPLLLKPEMNSNKAFIPGSVLSVDAQNPAARSFYILSCFCKVTQSTLNELVSLDDQIKHSEAEMNKGDTSVPEFSCPKCSKKCNNYKFDWQAVNLFRQNFTGARFTYILIDVTSSMRADISQLVSSDKKSKVPRIVQTKEAVKQLLKEIAANATPLDQAIVAGFDDKLHKAAIIPQCRALDIADSMHLERIDTITLSSMTVKTHFYSVLKEVYEMFEYQPYLYIDFYVFSDGIDTSPKRNDRAYQALIRGLNERIGAKCHFINSNAPSKGFSVSAWLGDPDADSLISGTIDEIRFQMSASYQKDHPRTSDSTKVETRFRGKTLHVPTITVTSDLTDAEAKSIRRPRPRSLLNENNASLNLATSGSNPDVRKDINDYLNHLPSHQRSRSATATEPRGKEPELFRMITRNLSARKLIRN